MVRCIDLTLRSNEKSQSSSEQSKMVPVVHEAGGIEQDVGLADALGEGVDVGGVANVELCRLGDAFLGERRDALSLISVAMTVAPSRANAMAQARPMPAAAAVTTARLPFRRSDIVSSFDVIPVRCEHRTANRNSVCPSTSECWLRFGFARNDGRRGDQ
jgi:hypothetical protein